MPQIPNVGRFSRKIFPQDFPQDFSTRFSCKIFLQEFPARFSHKIFSQDFPKLDPDWLAPHHPIPNAKFPPITAFLKLTFCLPPFSRKILSQVFPARFSHKNFLQNFPELHPDWLAPHHPIPNAKFPPITAFLKSTFAFLHFLQEFPARFSHKKFLQDFPELDPDWLAPNHPISNVKFPPNTAFLKLTFPLLHFLQDFPARISHKIFQQDFPARISHKIFLS